MTLRTLFRVRRTVAGALGWLALGASVTLMVATRPGASPELYRVVDLLFLLATAFAVTLMVLPLRARTRPAAPAVRAGLALLAAAGYALAGGGGYSQGTAILVAAVVGGWTAAPLVASPARSVPARAEAALAVGLLGLCALLRAIAPGHPLLTWIVTPAALTLGPGLPLARWLVPDAGAERWLLGPAIAAGAQVLTLLWLDLAGVAVRPFSGLLVAAACAAAGLLGSARAGAAPLPEVARARAVPLARPRGLARAGAALSPRPRWEWVTALAWLWLAALTWTWLSRDTAYFFWDPAFHAFSAVDLLREPLQTLLDTRPRFPLYPPLGHAVLALLYRVSGYDLDVTVWAYNLGFAGLLLAATSAIGRHLFSPRAGALAAICLVAYPEVFVRLRFPLLDLPLMAMVAATMYALLRADGFRDRRWSIAFGALLGLGQLLKHVHVLMVLLPLCAALLLAARRGKLANPLLAAAVSAAVALPWWAPRLRFFVQEWVPIQQADAVKYGAAGTFSVAGISYYSLGIWYETSLVFAVLWLLALPAFLRLRAGRPVLLWWVGAFFVLTAVPNKQTRYVAPLLPAVALMTGAGIDRWRRASLVLPLAAGFAVLQGTAQSFGVSWLPEGRMVHPVTLAEPLQVLPQHSHMEQGYWPDPGGWGLTARFRSLRGKVVVLDPWPGAQEDRYRTAFVTEAAQLQWLKERAQGADAPSFHAVTCTEAEEIAAATVVLVPVGPPSSAFAGSPVPGCLDGLVEDTRWPLVRGPGRPLSDFLGITAVAVMQPRALDVPLPPVLPGGELRFARVSVTVGGTHVGEVRVRIHSLSPREETAVVGSVVAVLGVDPWTRHVFASPPRQVPVPAAGEVDVVLEAPSALPPGDYQIAVALHRVTAQGPVAAHWAAGRLHVGPP